MGGAGDSGGRYLAVEIGGTVVALLVTGADLLHRQGIRVMPSDKETVTEVVQEPGVATPTSQSP